MPDSISFYRGGEHCYAVFTPKLKQDEIEGLPLPITSKEYGHTFITAKQNTSLFFPIEVFDNPDAEYRSNKHLLAYAGDLAAHFNSDVDVSNLLNVRGVNA